VRERGGGEPTRRRGLRPTGTSSRGELPEVANLTLRADLGIDPSSLAQSVLLATDGSATLGPIYARQQGLGTPDVFVRGTFLGRPFASEPGVPPDPGGHASARWGSP